MLRRSLPLQLGRVLAVAALTLCGLAAQPVAAKAKPSVSVFYTATGAAYKAWEATTSTARPKKTASFGCHTTSVSFYFEYKNAVPGHTQFQILVYLHTGNGQDPTKPETKSGRVTASHVNGMVMGPVGDNPDYEGPYRAVVMLDGHAAAHTDFETMIDGGNC